MFVLGRRGKGGGGWGNVRRGGDDGNGKGGVKASKWGIGGVEGENCQWREGKWGGRGGEGGRRGEIRVWTYSLVHRLVNPLGHIGAAFHGGVGTLFEGLGRAVAVHV